MTGVTYFNENDPFAADWLENLFDNIDRRSIKDVSAADLAGFNRCHFFAGIGGWECGLQLAGWPVEREVWTGSCPCQPFSIAGKGKGVDDERHLWPEFLRLIAERMPATVVGEQVASKAGREWLARVRADLEQLGYAVGAADLCAASIDVDTVEVVVIDDISGEEIPITLSVGPPHIRQRLFWVADLHSAGLQSRWQAAGENGPEAGDDCRLGNSIGVGRSQGRHDHRANVGSVAGSAGHVGGMVNVPDSRPQGLGRDGDDGSESGRVAAVAGRSIAAPSLWVGEYRPCRDGKLRRVPVPESGIQPLAHGLSRELGQRLTGVAGVDNTAIRAARRNRVGRLRGYGNAIVPQLAAEFIRAFMEAT